MSTRRATLTRAQLVVLAPAEMEADIHADLDRNKAILRRHLATGEGLEIERIHQVSRMGIDIALGELAAEGLVQLTNDGWARPTTVKPD